MSDDPYAFRNWTAASQDAALDELRVRTRRPWRPFWCPKPGCDGKPHDDWAWNHARADQHPPKRTDWLTWLLKSGRGSGKTRTASEYTHRIVRKVPRIGIIGATAPDIRGIMLEGESGLLTIAKPDFRPVYEPSKRKITWPNGAIGLLFSAEEPDRLRGPEHYFAWWDEPAHAPLVQECWDNLMFGLRLGSWPRLIASTTPKPRPWMKSVMSDLTTVITTSSTYDNIDNLAPIFAERVIARYEGTRLGRQELYGEVLEDVEGALWTYEMIEQDRVAIAPHLDHVVVSVDPAGTVNRRSDETGIVVVGVADGHLYVLADRTGRYTPHGWATAVDAAYEQFGADAIVAEDNYGGDMVDSTLSSVGVTKRVHRVNSRRGKAIRAEPVVSLYEQHKVHHVGVLGDLEDEMTSWVAYDPSEPSPNRVDALVHGATHLVKPRKAADIASPAHFRKDLQRHTARANIHH